MEKEIINMREELKDNKEATILEMWTFLALCGSTESSRKEKISELDKKLEGNLAMGFAGDNQMFLMNHYGRVYYMGELPTLYRDDPRKIHNFDLRIKNLNT
jgi:hypothetical protein